MPDLDIETPIVQASIDQATNSAMAAAVSNASGLGKLTFLRRNADEVRRLIGETPEQTDRPFSANFICGDWMAPAKESMPAPDIVKEIAEEAVQVMRNANDLIRE